MKLKFFTENVITFIALLFILSLQNIFSSVTALHLIVIEYSLRVFMSVKNPPFHNNGNTIVVSSVCHVPPHKATLFMSEPRLDFQQCGLRQACAASF